MNTDCYYEIGHSHIFCEDYALAGIVNNIGYAIVSDGCSSSDNVDVGARVLAHIAKVFLRNLCLCNADVYRTNTSAIFKDLKPSEFCVPIISEAWGVMKNLDLDDGAIDATLMMAISNGTETRVFVYGDGCIVVKYRNGTSQLIRVEFMESAPFYLSYSIDPLRKSEYLDIFRKGAVIHKNDIVDGLLINHTSERFESQYIHDQASWIFNDIEGITLISDGVLSYEKKHENKTIEKIDLDKVIHGIARYKNFNGQFVERRMNNFKKECQKEGIGHYDDISCASINLGRS